MLKVFIGYDDRQKVSYTALQQSIFETASQPVAVSPLILHTLPITRRGLTPFTFSRFLVPWLCDYQGAAIFMDADMLLVSDICELMESIREDVAVSVVTSLEQYEQTSFMLFNCAHEANRQLTPDFIQNTDTNLHGLEWLSESQIGSLEPCWNQLVGYQEVDLSKGNIHYTMGIPAFPETATSPGAQAWRAVMQEAMSMIPWVNIMGDSVHAIEINGIKFPRYVWDFEKNAPKLEHQPLIDKVLAHASQSSGG